MKIKNRCHNCVHWDVIDGGYETEKGIEGVVMGCNLEGASRTYSDRRLDSFACNDDFEKREEEVE